MVQGAPESCPMYHSKALFAIEHSTSFLQLTHSLGIGSPFGSFFKNPSIVHAEESSLATFVDVAVFICCFPLLFGNIVKNRTKKTPKKDRIVSQMKAGESRSIWLSLEITDLHRSYILNEVSLFTSNP